MKWFISFATFAALQFISAFPTSPPEHTLIKRAAYNDIANLGYATTNGGTTGGSGGTVTTVSTLSALASAVSGTAKKIVVISGTITGNTVVLVGSNTSVIGLRGSSLVGVGLRVYRENNVIIRNVKISKVLADFGDAIGIQEANQVWIDHVDLSSDLDHDKLHSERQRIITTDLNSSYDGLIDITHGSTGITISYSRLYNHWKASLVGHSDSNGSEDTNITVTYALNYWSNLNSRTPSFRFGRGHIFNNFYENINDGINRAQLIIENNVFVNTKNPIYSTSSGFIYACGNDGVGVIIAPSNCTFAPHPLYGYGLIPTPNVRSVVTSQAGQVLTF
ncbi:hypothetical protein AX16_010067 [Volvariella volvacea WC 439]|nr:hypothetical protein AX16_010067 [Volvariella volvacea WC 439]